MTKSRKYNINSNARGTTTRINTFQQSLATESKEESIEITSLRPTHQKKHSPINK